MEMEDKHSKIGFTPPGLKVFRREFLKGFTADSLSIEEDFMYKKRDRLKDLEIPDDVTESIFKDPLTFLSYLCPEACSALISDESDFIKVCDYVFYFGATATDPLTGMVFRKALFDLAKNYEYKWKLRLKHVITVLEVRHPGPGRAKSPNSVSSTILYR